MKTTRISSAGKARIKAAARQLVTLAGGLESAEMVCRASKTSLHRYTQPGDDQHIPADVLADLEADVGDPIVTRVLAALAGYQLVPAGPTGDLPGAAPMLAALRLEAEMGAFSGAVVEMEADGRRDPWELDLCLAKLRAVIAAAQRTEDMLYRLRRPGADQGGGS